MLAPLVAGMTATRASLLEWVHAHGLVALQAVFKAEAEALAGPKGLSVLTPSGRSERSYNVAPPRSAKFNSARDNPSGRCGWCQHLRER